MGGEPSRPEQTSSQEVPSAFAPPAAPSGDKGFSWQARSGARVVARHELRGALGPSELAEAAVLGDLALVLEVLGWFVPLVGAAFQGLAVVPFAALAARQRARTAVVAMLAASSVSFLVGGVGIVLQTAVAGTLGLAVGTAYRRRWNPGAAVLIAGVTTAIPVAAISLLAQALSPGLRRLAFAQVQILWRDMRRCPHARRYALCVVFRGPSASLGHRSLVAQRARVRAARRPARCRPLCPVSVAAARAPRS